MSFSSTYTTTTSTSTTYFWLFSSPIPPILGGTIHFFSLFWLSLISLQDLHFCLHLHHFHLGNPIFIHHLHHHLLGFQNVLSCDLQLIHLGGCPCWNSSFCSTYSGCLVCTTCTTCTTYPTTILHCLVLLNHLGWWYLWWYRWWLQGQRIHLSSGGTGCLALPLESLLYHLSHLSHHHFHHLYHLSHLSFVFHLIHHPFPPPVPPRLMLFDLHLDGIPVLTTFTTTIQVVFSGCLVLLCDLHLDGFSPQK